jgi:pimeloyl-ACP methyl ester carboxylesterase
MKHESCTLPDDRKLHYSLCGTGSVTVIFESGLTCDRTYWHSLQNKLAENAVTLSYDRAGIGQSDAIEGDKSLENITNDLVALINELKLTPPFVFVGHSFGGFLLKHYSSHYESTELGLVLVDPSDSYFEAKTLQYRTSEQREYWQSLSSKADPNESLAEKQEYKVFYEISEANKHHPYRSEIPTHILVCDNLSSWFDPEKDPIYQYEFAPKAILEKDNETWIQCHKKWLDQVPNARFTVVKNSSHSIHLDQEDVVFSAIGELIDQLNAQG